MNLPKSFCNGFVVFYKTENNDLETVLVTNENGNHSFPKGKREKKESDFECAYRELKEESDINKEDITVINEIVIDEYSTNKDSPSVRYFIAMLNEKKQLKFVDPTELDSVRYYKIDEALNLVNLKNTRKEVLKTALKVLNNEHLNQKYFQIGLNGIEDNKKYTKLSKSLSWLLRHGILETGIYMDSNGFVKISDVLKLDQFKEFKLNDLMYVVNNSDKQRFSFSEDMNQIRANQGHSKEIGDLINDDELLTKITEPFDHCYHGTDKKSYDFIKKDGLKPMSRKHVHMASGLESESVVSGMRKNCQVILEIDMKQAMEDGHEFYLSKNGVILSEKSIHPKYIRKINDYN